MLNQANIDALRRRRAELQEHGKAVGLIYTERHELEALNAILDNPAELRQLTHKAALATIEDGGVLHAAFFAPTQAEANANKRRYMAAEKMERALTAFAKAWQKSHQLEKTDVAYRLACEVLTELEAK